MPALPNNAVESVIALTSMSALNPLTIRGMNCSGEHLTVGAEDLVVGNVAPPSIRIDNWGYWRFRWSVASGTRTISIYAKQAINMSPRPTLVERANPAIGVNADVTGTAGSSTGFIQIGPVTISPSSAGAVWVELWNNYNSQYLATPT